MKISARISLYWKCQLVGWLIAGLYWALPGPFPARVNYTQMIFDFIGDFTICISLTHCYRKFALSKNWHTLRLKNLVPRIIPVIFLLGVSFMVLIAIKLYVVRIYFANNFDESFGEFFAASWLTLFVTGVRLMSIWVLAYHMYHYAQREINTTKENARLSVIAKDAQLLNLSAQLNPHFLFNSLNNIKFLVKEHPESARRAIDLLSDLFRNSLYCNDDKLIPLKEEISLVKDYLELEKLRFEERLQMNIMVEDSLSEILIPPLSIQVLVENAIKHGIDKRKEGGIVTVRVVQEDDRIKITVQNPGKLGAELQSPGLGLKNLEERLRLQYNGKATFDIVEQNEIVLATILIPAS